MKYISHSNFVKFLETLKNGYQVYVPVKKENQRFYKKYTEFTDDIVIGEVRGLEPLKAFFVSAKEKIVEGFSPDIPHSEDKPYAIVGAKSCDLQSLKIQDHVFKDHDFEDPFYIKNREQNLIITADCTCVIETCFCSALEEKPYPEESFDINLSELRGGFIVQDGSEKGQELLAKNSSLFEEAKQELISERDQNRERVVNQLQDNVKEFDVPKSDVYRGIIERNFESDIWQDQAKTCVECGACTSICPTCHCFLLYDQKDEKRMARFRMWDSCMLKNYARVAGGANPRGKLWMRLRNRFEKKFDFFPKVADMYACTGCGRCISACPAKIDIRKVLKKLVEA